MKDDLQRFDPVYLIISGTGEAKYGLSKNPLIKGFR